MPEVRTGTQKGEEIVCSLPLTTRYPYTDRMSQSCRLFNTGSSKQGDTLLDNDYR